MKTKEAAFKAAESAAAVWKAWKAETAAAEAAFKAAETAAQNAATVRNDD
jgi:hypothetical protein